MAHALHDEQSSPGSGVRGGLGVGGREDGILRALDEEARSVVISGPGAVSPPLREGLELAPVIRVEGGSRAIGEAPVLDQEQKGSGQNDAPQPLPIKSNNGGWAEFPRVPNHRSRPSR